MSNAGVFLLREFGTIVVALALSAAVFRLIPKPIATPSAPITLPAGHYIPNPADDPVTTAAALRWSLGHGDLVVFGSSELTRGDDSALQRTYPGGCGKRVLTMGQAGFQSLPITMTLAEHRASLSARSRVAVVLSPGWFAERGTPSGAFLKFLRPHQLETLTADPDLPAGVRESLAREIRVRRDELTGLYPDWLYPAWPALARIGRRALPNGTVAADAAPIVEPAVKIAYDWTAAEFTRRSEDSARVDNPYGVTPEYWAKIKNNVRPKPAPRIDPYGYEVRDLMVMSELLRDRGVRAEFIVQPIHRMIYKDLSAFDALFADLTKRLVADGHHVRSFLEGPFDPTVLDDSAHFSRASWIRIARELCP